MDDLKVDFTPFLFWEQSFQIFFRLNDCFPIAQPPSVGASMDVGVDWEGRLVECLGHYDRGCFVAHSRQIFQLFEAGRDLASMPFHQLFREAPDRF